MIWSYGVTLGWEDVGILQSSVLGKKTPWLIERGWGKENVKNFQESLGQKSIPFTEKTQDNRLWTKSWLRGEDKEGACKSWLAIQQKLENFAWTVYLFFSRANWVALVLGDVSHVVSTSVLVQVFKCGNTKVFNPFVSSLLYPPVLVGRETRRNHPTERTWSHNNILKLMPWEMSVLAREMLPVKGKDSEP